MIPQGLEVRPELQVRSDVLAFGFSGEHVADDTAVGLLQGDFLNYILTTAETTPTGLVVVDMRNVESLSTTSLGRFLALYKKLGQVRWKLVLMISDPILRELFSTTHLDHLFLVAANEGELHELAQRYALVLSQTPSQKEPPEFSASELTEIEAAGITLEDAIQTVEGLRR
jgi:anti-anti-sigma factor